MVATPCTRSNAGTGAIYWEHDYTGRPDKPPSPDTDGTRIFSSPVVADGVVLFGLDVDGAAGYEGYVVGASLATGNPVWEYQTDANAQGKVLDNGCGSVWSSGTVLPALGSRCSARRTATSPTPSRWRSR